MRSEVAGGWRRRSRRPQRILRAGDPRESWNGSSRLAADPLATDRVAARDPGSGRERVGQDDHHRQARCALLPGRPGKSVILGAGDTFRAAASEQLQIWGERVGCDVVRGPSGGDPSAVAFDTVKAAVARQVRRRHHRHRRAAPDQEAVDGGAGEARARDRARSSRRAPRMRCWCSTPTPARMRSRRRACLDEVTKVTGLVLTKLDGTAKGGVLVGLADEFGIPVRVRRRRRGRRGLCAIFRQRSSSRPSSRGIPAPAGAARPGGEGA